MTRHWQRDDEINALVNFQKMLEKMGLTPGQVQKIVLHVDGMLVNHRIKEKK